MQDSLGNIIWDQQTSEPNAGSVSFGGTSAGTANAQTLSAAQFGFLDGQIISFVAGVTNTGTMTIAVGGGNPIPVLKNGVTGPVNLVAGDMQAGNSYFIQYSASLAAFQLLLNVAPALPTGTFLTGYLFGLTLSNDGGDPTNTIDITTGLAASDGATPVLMNLGSALAKKLNVNWQVGTNQGGLDTGSITNGTYHVFLIQRSDTGIVDVLFSLSATTPTMPANYDRKRRIGSIQRESGSIVQFRQYGDIFKRSFATNYVLGFIAATPLAVSVPLGIKVRPIMSASMGAATASDVIIDFFDGDDPTGTSPIRVARVTNNAVAGVAFAAAVCDVAVTNTSAVIYLTVSGSGSVNGMNIITLGWIDTRGRLS